MTNPEALKEVYVALGGAEEDVADIDNNAELISKIAEVASGGEEGGGGGSHVIALTGMPTSTYKSILPSGVTYASILAELEAGTIPLLKIPTSASGKYIYAPFFTAYTATNTLNFAYWEYISSQSGTTGVRLTKYTVASNNQVRQDANNINFATNDV